MLSFSCCYSPRWKMSSTFFSLIFKRYSSAIFLNCCFYRAEQQIHVPLILFLFSGSWPRQCSFSAFFYTQIYICPFIMYVYVGILFYAWSGAVNDLEKKENRAWRISRNKATTSLSLSPFFYFYNIMTAQEGVRGRGCSKRPVYSHLATLGRKKRPGKERKRERERGRKEPVASFFALLCFLCSPLRISHFLFADASRNCGTDDFAFALKDLNRFSSLLLLFFLLLLSWQRRKQKWSSRVAILIAKNIPGSTSFYQVSQKSILKFHKSYVEFSTPQLRAEFAWERQKCDFFHEQYFLTVSFLKLFVLIQKIHELYLLRNETIEVSVANFNETF